MILHGNCLDILPMLDADSFDSVVTDPPYGLSKEPDMAEVLRHWLAGDDYEHNSKGFMGKSWDSFVPGPSIWREVYRVLKPGGHVLAFFGTRTYDMGVLAMRLAGFEIRDQVQWIYGCLDEQTMAVTSRGVMPYHKINKGDLVLSYNTTDMTYEWQPVEEVLAYDVDDTVYRIATDYGEQVVSRNHRCIVERGGKEVFQLAEEAARQHEIRVPVLEDLRALLDAVSGAHESAGDAQPYMLSGVQGGTNICGGNGRCVEEVRSGPRGEVGSDLLGLRGDFLAEHEAFAEGFDSGLLVRVQRSATRSGLEGARAQGQGELVGGVGVGFGGADDRADQPCVEGRGDVSKQERQLRVGSVRTLPLRVHADVSQGRVRDGASPECCEGNRPLADSDGVRSPHRPRPAEQHADQPDALRNEQGSQTVRKWHGHKTVVGRVTSERYRGVIWCVRVKSGAFVAVRNGFAFPTGNSGFPKSHDVSKAIDKMAGAEREVVGERKKLQSYGLESNNVFGGGPDKGGVQLITVPATAEAAQWAGYGTALKPAHEPIVVARKPLIGTVAENVLAHGVGGLNIDGCRVGDFVNTTPPGTDRYNQANFEQGYRPSAYGREGEASAERRYTDRGSTNFAATPGPRGGAPEGRWPANVVISYPEDEYELVPSASAEQRDEVRRWFDANP